MTIERPGDVFAPGADMAEARRRADTADKLSNRRDGLRWRPAIYEILVDNRRRDPKAPVLLKTRVYDSEVVTEWRHHPSPIPTCYHVFEVGKDDAERTFGVERGADALSYHAKLEGAIRERRKVSREICRRRRSGALLGDLLRDFTAEQIVEARGVLRTARDLGV